MQRCDAVVLVNGQQACAVWTLVQLVAGRGGGLKAQVDGQGGETVVPKEQSADAQLWDGAFKDGGVAPGRNDAVGRGVVVRFEERARDRVGVPPAHVGAQHRV